MKCPHCGYENFDNLGNTGFWGHFFESAFLMSRENEQKLLYACPDCGKTFIRIEH